MNIFVVLNTTCINNKGGIRRVPSLFHMKGETQWQSMKKRLGSSLSKFLIVAPAVLRVPSLLICETESCRIKPTSSKGKCSETHYITQTWSNVWACIGPPKGPKGAGGSAHWATFLHLVLLIEEVSIDWRLGYMMPIYKEGQKEDLGNYRPDCGIQEGHGVDEFAPSHVMYRRTRESSPAIMGLVCEKQVLLDFLLLQDHPLCGWGKECGCCPTGL